jgi:hypothetical protein
MFFLFKTFSPMLAGKENIIQTDHQNVLWMENNQTPIVIRWRIYMQSFMHKVQLIAGKKMGLADYLSRMYSVKDITEEFIFNYFNCQKNRSMNYSLSDFKTLNWSQHWLCLTLWYIS